MAPELFEVGVEQTQEAVELGCKDYKQKYTVCQGQAEKTEVDAIAKTLAMKHRHVDDVCAHAENL